MLSGVMFESGFYERTKCRKASHLCPVKGCRKHRTEGRRVCIMHYMRWWRFSNPDKAAFYNLKGHARDRKIPFTLTYDEFLDLYVSVAAFDGIPSFDRIDACRGYENGNVAVVSIGDNVAKGNRERKLPEHVQEMIRRARESAEEDPF